MLCPRAARLLHLNESLDIDDTSLYFTKRGQPLKLSVANDKVSVILVMTTIDKAPETAAQGSASAASTSGAAPRETARRRKPKQTTSSSSSSSSSSLSRSNRSISASQSTSEDDAVELPRTGKRMPPGGVKAKGKPSAKPPTATTQQWMRQTEAKEYEELKNAEGEDEDDGGPVGPSHRRTATTLKKESKISRVVLDDDDDNDDDTKEVMTEGTQSQSQTLSNSPSIPPSQCEAVTALSDLGRKRLQHSARTGKVSLLDDSEDSN